MSANESIETEKLPTCIGFIVDGNRRWAKEQGLTVPEGHKRGLEVVEDVVRWAASREIPHLIFYGFSTENWNRSPIEVVALCALFEQVLTRFVRDGVGEMRLQFIGERERFSESLQKLMATLEEDTGSRSGICVTMALSYGGRSEIVSAVNRAIAEGNQVDEASFSALLSTANIPDPDLIVRTSGEQRLSNFLPWQAVYSELYFTKTYWPAFTEAEFAHILRDYVSRSRRRGR